MNIALIGPSGAGKGTHAIRLAGVYGLRQVSTGDLFRENLRANAALGLLARKYMQLGELVPDEVVDAMIEEWCTKLPAGHGALFDGFPRTLEQARFLDELLGRVSRPLDAVIYLQVSDAEIARRDTGRIICRTCQAPYHLKFQPPHTPGVCDRCRGELYQRHDDTAEFVQSRLRIFYRSTMPVIDHYASAGKLVIVPGEGSIEDVDRRLIRVLDGIRTRSLRFATRDEAAQLPRPPLSAAVPRHLARTSLDLVLLGGPGSGKGTQAAMLSKELGLPHIATGDLFRENLKQATELGKLAKTYMERGELVPDDVTDAMVAERLSRPDSAHGFILDGFPRTLHQAEALMEIMARLQRRLTGVLYIKVTDEEIVRRLSGRLICRNCQVPYHTAFKPSKKPGVCDACGGELYQRADDNPATVRARLATFHAQTEPLIDYYQRAGLLHEIVGEGEVADIRQRCLSAIAQPQSHSSPRMAAVLTGT